MPKNETAYRRTTNLCLIIGIASAFGYEADASPGWVVLGGAAATIAITLYFRRHWQQGPKGPDLRLRRRQAPEPEHPAQAGTTLPVNQRVQRPDC